MAFTSGKVSESGEKYASKNQWIWEDNMGWIEQGMIACSHLDFYLYVDMIFMFFFFFLFLN